MHMILGPYLECGRDLLWHTGIDAQSFDQNLWELVDTSGSLIKKGKLTSGDVIGAKWAQRQCRHQCPDRAAEDSKTCELHGGCKQL
jgi:hypothetical protein